MCGCGRYRVEIERTWLDWAWYGKRFRWTATIWRDESPWGIADMSPFMRYRWQARKWATRWLTRAAEGGAS